jgi:hypothetical protein
MSIISRVTILALVVASINRKQGTVLFSRLKRYSMSNGKEGFCLSVTHLKIHEVHLSVD